MFTYTTDCHLLLNGEARSLVMPSMVCSDLNRALSDEFLIPSNRDIGVKTLPEENGGLLLLRHLTSRLLRSYHPADQRCTYLCGNSLGPLNKRSKALLQEELHVWETR
jgi:kynureninase